MAVTTFGVTYTDVESALEGFSLSDKTTEIAAIITRVAATWNAYLVREGVTPANVTSAEMPICYSISQWYVILKASAEAGRRFTHQNPDLSRQRDEEANELKDLLHASPEAVVDTWDVNQQRGSWRSNTELVSREPGELASIRGPRKKPWGRVF